MQISSCIPSSTSYTITCGVLSKYFPTANCKESNETYVFTAVLHIQQLVWIPMYKYGCRTTAGSTKQNLNCKLMTTCVSLINCATHVLEVMHLISRIANRTTPDTEIFISTTYTFLFIYQRPFISLNKLRPCFQNAHFTILTAGWTSRKFVLDSNRWQGNLFFLNTTQAGSRIHPVILRWYCGIFVGVKTVGMWSSSFASISCRG
jgi:hypothetical protein